MRNVNMVCENNLQMAQAGAEDKRERCMLMTEVEKRRERRARQKQRRREDPLDSRDACGVSDPTPMQAIDNIIRRR